MAEYQQRLGRRIAQAREAKGWSQPELAHHLPPSKYGKPRDGSTISRYERGVVTPGSETLEALAAVLEVDVAWFYENDEKPAETPSLLDAFGGSQLDRIEGKIDRLLVCLLTPEQRGAYEGLAELAAELGQGPGPPQRRTRRA